MQGRCAGWKVTGANSSANAGALGVNPSRLRVMVLKHVGAMALVGGAIGLAAAVTFGRSAETQGR